MRTRRSQAFTLIELLTVIVIIAILVALLFPAIQSALRKAEAAQARTDVNAIVNAVTAYKNEYGKLPIVDSSQGGPDSGAEFGGLTGNNNSQVILALLGGTGVAGGIPASVLNPRNIGFLQAPTRKGSMDSSWDMLDPWGTQYLIELDTSYNNTIQYPCGTYGVIPGIVVASSYGPNKTCDDPAQTTGDDIYSFK
jgi:prepilin-type N-terminal cleavage/methylation domain-containing protein